LLEEYLTVERGKPGIAALWVGRRQAAGRPLRYPAFEVSLRATAARLGVHATAHMFRHTVAQHLVEIAGLTVAKEVLGHQHISTTAEEYTHVDEAAMLAALTEVARRQRSSLPGAAKPPARYAFPYSAEALSALDEITDGRRR
jgi:integrase